ncbi:GDSL-type esterase/lipase family protein [Siccirubricoccus sp. KC 17139]|uniref:GDSL-type esterase/lipase family protein n=1 Tax=Siccirubricoccus soli TaxID=2899147 RepID=A0ABT1DA60_9PROT|nr:GDSL-type esterase/lipase family protein [Siccirubricoccus soli]MCO6418828.1 GDSL-type esterase/lipase family protein [Siccirubricoccus soli]MCP2684963.1 GDSL-type esterase/lipase family protein [Siccirubricoccus soli]
MPGSPAGTSRRTLLGKLGAGLLLSGCDLARGGVPVQAAGPSGAFRSLAELEGWTPEWRLAPAVPEAAPMPAAAGAGDPLAPFHRALAQLEARRASQPVLIVQFGDSHTAGPFFIARLRELFQARYGAIGPGRLPPGQAPRFYRPALVQVEQQGPWEARNALRAGTPGPFGIAGYRLRASAPGSRILLRSTEPEGFDRFSLDVLVQPGGGQFRLALDGVAGPVLRSRAPEQRRAPVPLDLPRRVHEAAVEVLGDGPVELLGWGAERRGPGVLVEGHGINGATIDMLSNLDQAILQDDLAARPPALILLAYGTNEAVDAGLSAEAYAAQLTGRVRALRRMAPQSAMLLIGAPDAARRVGRHPQGCGGWAPLPGLAAVKAAQARVAAAEKLAFWDWAEVTGGICRLDALTRGTPKLVQDDHVHLTAEGYRLSAERLFDRLMRRQSMPMARTI